MMQIKLSDVGFSGPSACVLCAVACFLLHDLKSTVQAWREREALRSFEQGITGAVDVYVY
jgi:hypothetical protein